MKTNSQKKSQRASIDREIDSALTFLREHLLEDLVAERVRVPKGMTACKGMIKVFSKEEKELESKNPNHQAVPFQTYAFYDSSFNPSKLGSVAIYGEWSYNLASLLKANGILFGRRIREVKVEQGLELFVDVRF